MAAPALGRAQVIAYRVAAQGLHRQASSVDELDVLGLGIQEAMGHPASTALVARLPETVVIDPSTPAVGPGTALALAWTFRGAPHVHPRADLDTLAGALWPLSEADATTRLNETGPSVRRAGIDALDQFRAAVDALSQSVCRPTAKGTASTSATRLLPPPMRRDCRVCKAAHISDSAMRIASLPAGLELEPGTAPPVLRPRAGARQPRQPDRATLRALAVRYLELLGPAGVGEFAGYLDARRADVAGVWPDDLLEVHVDGVSRQLPEHCLAGARSAPEPDLVRLLGPFDPYLQARDRDLIVPDRAMHRTLWPVLGRPGVVLAGGEVAGTWRTRAGKKQLTIAVAAFGPWPRRTWTRLEDEAERVAASRGLPDVRVVEHT